MFAEVGAYTRISEAGETGSGLDGRDGVRRQQEDCYALARERGVTVSKVYEDNDVSAFKRKVKRPAFEALVRDLADGRLGGIIAYDIDRIARQPRDLERLIDIYEQSRRPLVFATCARDFDLATDEGRFHARLLVSLANKASADASRRLTRQRLAEAEAGKAYSCGRSFGWRDAVHTDPVEAELIRRARKDILDGKRVSTLHREWAAAGVRGAKTPEGKSISYSSVLYVLRNPRLCGFRSYVPLEYRAKRGRVNPAEFILERVDGTPVVGEWEPILTPEEWWELIDELDSRGRAWAEKKPGGAAHRRLLGGIARCGRCGSAMQGGVYGRKSPSYEKYVYNYACKQASGGCAGVTRVGPPVDDLVESALFSRLHELAAKPETERCREAENLERTRDELNQVERDKVELRRFRASGDLSVPEFVREMKRLENVQQKLKEHVADLRESSRPGRHTAARILRDWPDYTVDMRREAIRRFIEAVVIHPTGRGGNHAFKPETVDIVWQRQE